MLAWLHEHIGFNPLAWARSVPVMRNRIADYLPTLPATENGLRVLVVVIPWLGTFAPWFTLCCGLLLAGRGCRVTFAFDDQPFGPKLLRHRIVSAAIGQVMKTVSRRFEVVRLSDVPPGASTLTPQELERLARLNATWALRGETVTQGREAYERMALAQMRAASARISPFMQRQTQDLMFVPGGVYGTSGLWVACARKAGIRVSSYDTGGYETVMLAAQGLACQLHDVPRAYRAILEQTSRDPGLRKQVLDLAHGEIDKRKSGSDKFESQIKGTGAAASAATGGVLIALNSSWDAASLGLQRVFAGHADWIIGTVRYLLDHTDLPVVVRQHPAERLAFAGTSDDYRALLTRHFGAHERLVFIAADDPVNSYALLRQVRAVVVHSSTIGLEAAAFGLPVVTSSSVYYSGLDFVHAADSIENYHRLLSAAASGELVPGDQTRENAAICFYVTQCCNWVFSVFNPGDYKRWSREDLAHWSAQPAVGTMMTSLIENVPVALLNHERSTAALAPAAEAVPA